MRFRTKVTITRYPQIKPLPSKKKKNGTKVIQKSRWQKTTTEVCDKSESCKVKLHTHPHIWTNVNIPTLTMTLRYILVYLCIYIHMRIFPVLVINTFQTCLSMNEHGKIALTNTHKNHSKLLTPVRRSANRIRKVRREGWGWWEIAESATPYAMTKSTSSIDGLVKVDAVVPLSGSALAHKNTKHFFITTLPLMKRTRNKCSTLETLLERIHGALRSTKLSFIWFTCVGALKSAVM